MFFFDIGFIEALFFAPVGFLFVFLMLRVFPEIRYISVESKAKITREIKSNNRKFGILLFLTLSSAFFYSKLIFRLIVLLFDLK